MKKLFTVVVIASGFWIYRSVGEENFNSYATAIQEEMTKTLSGATQDPWGRLAMQSYLKNIAGTCEGIGLVPVGYLECNQADFAIKCYRVASTAICNVTEF